MLGSDDELDWMPSALSKVSEDINPLPRVTESKLSQVLESTTTEAEQRTKILTPGFAHGAVDSVFNAYRSGAKCLIKGNRRTVTHGYSIIREPSLPPRVNTFKVHTPKKISKLNNFRSV